MTKLVQNGAIGFVKSLMKHFEISGCSRDNYMYLLYKLFKLTCKQNDKSIIGDFYEAFNEIVEIINGTE